jgi:aryl-alcohol dehydrogenase-like predicted oxidoreductase
VSKLVIVTAQFGLDYGIFNKTERTSSANVKNILTLAKKKHINTLDTAFSYGSSEQVLGKIGINDFQVITKTSPLNKGVENVIDCFYQSLEKLNKTEIYGLLIHNISEVTNKEFSRLYKLLISFKEQGLIQKIGFSSYTPEQVNFLLENFDFDLIQLPINVFDQRLINGGQLMQLKNKGVEIHARSVFLQGILLELNKIPKFFFEWKDHFDMYKNELGGNSFLDFALGFVLNISAIDRVVVGVNNSQQLEEIIESSRKKIKFNSEDTKKFGIDDVNLLNPSNWKRP